MTGKTFDLGTVLSITTGTLLTDIGNIYNILNYMTGENLFTHQLPRVSRECEPVLLRQFPQLVGIDTDCVNRDNWREFLGEQARKYGDEFEVIPVGLFEHRIIDPIQEAVDMVGEDKVMILIPPEWDTHDNRD